MKTCIALFRGINVGGNTVLPMKDLVVILEQLGLENVRTYIQSGNVIFQSKEQDLPQLANKITVAIKQARDLSPQVLILSVKELQAAIASNPFSQGEHELRSLHLFFLDAVPHKSDLATLESIKTKTEQFKLNKRVFYLYAPDGIGRSKLAAKVEKALGVTVTARNWRTVNEIMTIATTLPG